MEETQSEHDSKRFCGSCGKELDKVVTFCPTCGHPVHPILTQPASAIAEEQILAEIPNSQEIGFGKGAQFDLYLTDTRLVAVKMGGRRVGGGFGIAGMLAEQAIKKHLADKKREKMSSLSLDQMLASDKSNCQIAYDTVQSIKLVSSTMQGKFLEVKYGNDEKKKYSLKKESIEQLKTTLPTVRILEGKLVLPN